jgi:hypothetical protein
VLDALQAGAAGWCTAGPCLRPQPCIDLYGAEALRRIRVGEFDADSCAPVLPEKILYAYERTYRELNVFGFFQHSTRVRDLRLADRYAPE